LVSDTTWELLLLLFLCLCSGHRHPSVIADYYYYYYYKICIAHKFKQARVRGADAPFVHSFVHSFVPSFLSSYSSSPRTCYCFLETCDCLEALTQPAEYSQFVLEHLCDQNVSPIPLSVTHIDPPRCKRCDGKSISLRQRKR